MLPQAPNPLNDSPLIFPALECAHILGFALSVGTIAVLDFRLLGLGLIHHPSAELDKDLAPWTLVGLAIMLLSGPAMFGPIPACTTSMALSRSRWSSCSWPLFFTKRSIAKSQPRTPPAASQN